MFSTCSLLSQCYEFKLFRSRKLDEHNKRYIQLRDDTISHLWLQKIFKDQWGDDEGLLSDNYDGSCMLAFFGCQAYLCSGESESEAHDHIRDAIKKEIGDCSIKTVWTYLGELPCEIFDD